MITIFYSKRQKSTITFQSGQLNNQEDLFRYYTMMKLIIVLKLKSYMGCPKNKLHAISTYSANQKKLPPKTSQMLKQTLFLVTNSNGSTSMGGFTRDELSI